ncbi:hypothetical protein ACHAWF_005102 [Thalassiosira exigua]
MRIQNQTKSRFHSRFSSTELTLWTRAFVLRLHVAGFDFIAAHSFSAKKSHSSYLHQATMSYQSNPGRAVQESYDDASANDAGTGPLLPNVGASNSARGEGTTAAELVAKFRFLNCSACLFVLLVHTLPIALNPIKLALLVSSPLKLIAEVILGLLALLLLAVEARIPILGEKALTVTNGIAVGGRRCMDLDTARGRVLALTLMAGSLGLINYLAMAVHKAPSSPDNREDASEIESGEAPEPSSNNTDAGIVDDTIDAGDNEAPASVLLVIMHCTVFSPTMWVLLLLLGYTLYVVHAFPEYAQSRGYSTQDEAPTQTNASTRPSWLSGNAGDFAAGTSGYQTVGV